MKKRLLAIIVASLWLSSAQNQGIPRVNDVPPKFYALLIAAQSYKNPGFPTLNRPIKDAKALQDILVKKYSFDSENTVIIPDKSRDQIMEAIYDMVEQITENDNLLIFFAGHGTYRPGSTKDDNEGFLIPVTGEPKKYYTFISTNDLATALKPCKAKHILLITDACFSGSLVNLNRDIKDATLDIRILYQKKSRQLMASGNLQPVPDNSIFIQYLLKSLSENNKNFLPSDDLFKLLRPGTINNTGGSTSPICGPLNYMGDENGQFIFFQKGQSIVEPSTENGFTINFFTGVDSYLYIDDKKVGFVSASQVLTREITEGTHTLKAVSTEFPDVSFSQERFYSLQKDGNTVHVIPLVTRVAALKDLEYQKKKEELDRKIKALNDKEGVSTAPKNNSQPPQINNTGETSSSLNIQVTAYSMTPIYDIPDMSGGKEVYKIKENEQVTVLAMANSKYYRVKVNNYTGYLLIAMVKTPPQSAILAGNENKSTVPASNSSKEAGSSLEIKVMTYNMTPIYDIPDISAGKEVYKIKDTEQVTLLEKTNSKYYRVKVNNYTGYLLIAMIKTPMESLSPSSTPSKSATTWKSDPKENPHLYDTNDPYFSINFHDYVEVFDNSPLCDIPDQVKGNIIARISDASKVKIIKKINNRYYSVMIGERSGFLFVGWIKTQL